MVKQNKYNFELYGGIYTQLSSILVYSALGLTNHFFEINWTELFRYT